MSADIIPLDAAIVRRRGYLDPKSDKHRALDQRLYESLLRQACDTDLRGLEVWWGNGCYRDGRVIGVEESDEDGLLVVMDSHHRHPLWEVLAAGWLQEPGDEDDDPDSDGYALTIRALARRRAGR
jgi:hypothetical protein